MAVKLIEGFDHLAVSDLGKKDWVDTSDANQLTSFSIETGRLAGYCLRLTGSARYDGAYHDGTVDLHKVYPSAAEYTTHTIGFAFRPHHLYSDGYAFVSVLDASGNIVAYITINGFDHTLKVRKADGTIVVNGPVMVLGAWRYIELETVAAGGSGSVTLYVDGVEWGTATGVDIGTAGVNTVRLTAYGAGNSGSAPHSQWDIDDIYCVNAAGSSPWNAPLGDVRVDTTFATADGANTDFTPDTGTDHYARVDESTPDGDTSYVASNTVGDKDTYAFADLTIASGSVFAIQTNLIAKKDDAATRQITSVVRQSGTDHDGATTHTLSTTYSCYSEIREQDPTSTNWTIATVNADEFGVKIIT